METLTIPQNKMEMSLSEIFDYADKNMKHAYWIYGSAKHNLCCANGAVAFILSDGRTTNPYKLKSINPKLSERYRELREAFAKKDWLGLTPNWYNDFGMYSFKKLAEKCRNMGL